MGNPMKSRKGPVLYNSFNIGSFRVRVEGEIFNDLRSLAKRLNKREEAVLNFLNKKKMEPYVVRYLHGEEIVVLPQRLTNYQRMERALNTPVVPLEHNEGDLLLDPNRPKYEWGLGGYKCKDLIY